MKKGQSLAFFQKGKHLPLVVEGGSKVSTCAVRNREILARKAAAR